MSVWGIWPISSCVPSTPLLLESLSLKPCAAVHPTFPLTLTLFLTRTFTVLWKKTPPALTSVSN
jgi:hypothetical protein